MYGVGDTIEVTMNANERQLTLARRHSIEKAEVELPIDGDEVKQLCFFVMATGPGDCIEMVE